ncbi:hypothetical protein GCM10028812_52980 [Ancylobacter sonchi]
MHTNAQPSPPTPSEADLTEPFTVTEEEIDEVLEICGGRPRDAMRALLIGQRSFKEVALDEARRETSWGYVRGRPSRKTKGRGDASEG